MSNDATGHRGFLCCIGDLVEDIVVHVDSAMAVGTDTEATIERRRGGSAANVAVAAANTGADVRFIGQVGDDAIGAALIEEMLDKGVDARVTREGRTGTILVLVDADGERSMLPDRATATELEDVSATDLDGVTWLHVPAYSLVVEPLSTAAKHAITTVRRSGGAVSIDASSVAIIERMGATGFIDMISALEPDVMFCNKDEADLLDVAASGGLDGVALTVVKTGSKPAVAYADGEVVATVPAQSLDVVHDTTGAGDAFAAGFITARMASADVRDAVGQGHRLAAELLRRHAP